MQRKLIAQGDGGFTIYLPSSWIKSKQLQAKDGITIKELAGNLIITSEKHQPTTATIDVSQLDNWELKLVLINAYQNCVDNIILKSNKPINKKYVQSIIESLMIGFEITKNEDKIMQIESMAEAKGEQYEKLLQKLFQIIKEYINNLYEATTTKNASILQANMKLYEPANKYLNLCRRIIFGGSYQEKNALIHWEMLTFISSIHQTLHYLTIYLQDNNYIDKELEPAFLSLKTYFDLYTQAINKKDLEAIRTIIQMRTDYQYGLFFEKIQKTNSHKSVVYSYLREIFGMLESGTRPIIAQIFEEV